MWSSIRRQRQFPREVYVLKGLVFTHYGQNVVIV